MVRQAFCYPLRFTSSSTVAVIDLNPVVTGASTFFGPSLVNFANLYQEFRFVSLEITVYPFSELPTATGNAATTLCLGFTPLVCASAPATLADCAALSECVLQVSGVSVPIVFRLGRKQLLQGAPVKWFHVDTSPDPDTGLQGQLHYINTGTNSTSLVQTWLVRSVIECRAPVVFGQFLRRMGIPQPLEDVKEDKEALDPPPSTRLSFDVVDESELSQHPDYMVRVIEPHPAVVSAASRVTTVVNAKPPTANRRKGDAF